MARIAIFLGISVAIVALSRRSIAHSRSHGFYRFFAFELLTALVLVNAPSWFHNPLSAPQLVSWSLGAASLALAIEGFRLLRVVGRPSSAAGGASDLGFERTTQLVTVGAYRFIRHPLYSSLLALVWCAFLKQPRAARACAAARQPHRAKRERFAVRRGTKLRAPSTRDLTTGGRSLGVAAGREVTTTC